MREPQQLGLIFYELQRVKSHLWNEKHMDENLIIVFKKTGLEPRACTAKLNCCIFNFLY